MSAIMAWDGKWHQPLSRAAPLSSVEYGRLRQPPLPGFERTGSSASCADRAKKLTDYRPVGRLSVRYAAPAWRCARRTGGGHASRDRMRRSMNENTKAARELADRFWEGLLEIEPLLGTWVGDERHDDRLPDASEAGLAVRKDFFEGALSDLAKIDGEDLDQDLRTTLDVLETGARRELSEIEHRIDRFAAVTHLFGPGNLLAEIASLQRADTPERLDRYVGRLSEIPSYLRAVGEVATGAVKAGQVSPVLVVDRSIHQVERLLAMDPAASPGLRPVESGSQEDRDRVI